MTSDMRNMGVELETLRRADQRAPADRTDGAAARITARTPCEGIADTTRSVPSSAASSNAVTATPSGSETSGR